MLCYHPFSIWPIEKSCMSGMFSIGFFVMEREIPGFDILTSFINQNLLSSLPILIKFSLTVLRSPAPQWCYLELLRIVVSQSLHGNFVFPLYDLSVIIKATVLFVSYIIWFSTFKLKVTVHSWSAKSFILSEIYKKKWKFKTNREILEHYIF